MNAHSMRRQRKAWWLVLGITGTGGLGWFMNTFSPSSRLTICAFFALFFAASSFLGLYALNNVRRAILLGLGVSAFLLLRYLQLRHPLYVVLLVASLISLEVFFQKR